MKKNAMLIDVYYCTGCHSCEVACQQENGFPAGVFGIKVTEMLLEKGDGLTIDYVPYLTDLCNGCAGRIAAGKRPNCVKHCLSQCMKFGPAEEIIGEAKEALKPMLFLK